MPKPLLPTLRERNRYMVFEIVSDSKFKRDEILKSVWGSVSRLLGEFETGKTSLWLTEWDEKTQKGILKANHKSIDKVRAAIALIKEIDKKPVIFHVLGISGTIKKAKAKF